MAVYIDPTEVPFDVYDVEDIGDAVAVKAQLEFEQIGGLRPDPTAKLTTSGTIPNNHPNKKEPHLVVPFTRTIQLGSTGRDVIGAKRAIWHGNGLKVPVNATQKFGVTAEAELKKFQKAHRIDNDGVLGPTTLKVLAPYFDQYAFMLYEGYKPGSNHQDRIVAYAWWGYNNRGAIGYAEFRPMQYMFDLQHLPLNEDCSTFSTKCYKAGDAIDPNRMGYNGYGNTSTQRAHGTVISVASCLPADLAHYNNPEHVAVIVRGGSNAAVISHGSGIGPLFLPIHYRSLYEVMRYSMI